MQEYIDSVEAIAPWFFPVFAFAIGTCIGSFLNVCIYRIPEGLSVVHPPSRCGACGKTIPFYNNIPILAWIFLKGKASCCGAPFSIRYPAIEFLTGLLFLASWMLLPTTTALIGFVWISILICVTFIDLDHMIIPDRFSIGGLIAGLILSMVAPSLHDILPTNPLENSIQGLFTAINGAFLGSAIILWIMILAEVILKKEALGFGDVKLMGAIGAFCGWQGAIFALFGGAVLGTIAIIIMQLIRFLKPKKQDATEEDESMIGREIPFGPMLAAGSLLYYLHFGPIVDWYFGQFSWVLP
jgi:leader peptidase (prepilin peptidase) / N-methyltransferase